MYFGGRRLWFRCPRCGGRCVFCMGPGRLPAGGAMVAVSLTEGRLGLGSTLQSSAPPGLDRQNGRELTAVAWVGPPLASGVTLRRSRVRRIASRALVLTSPLLAPGCARPPLNEIARTSFWALRDLNEPLDALQ